MEKSTSFLTIMRYWAYNILSFDTFTTIFDVLNWVCLFSMIFWLKNWVLMKISFFLSKSPIFHDQKLCPKNPLFTKFSKNTQKSVIMVLLHWLIKTWILEHFKSTLKILGFSQLFWILKKFFKSCHFLLIYDYVNDL